MIAKGELRPVLKQFLTTSTVRNALGQIRRICMLILGNKGLRNYMHEAYCFLNTNEFTLDELKGKSSQRANAQNSTKM